MEEKVKICPLQPPATYNPENRETTYFDCVKDTCEWWDSLHKCCCVFSISGELSHIAELLKG